LNLSLFQVSPKGRVDLPFAEILGGVLVPFVSNLALMNLIWNQSPEDYVETIFFFAKCFISKKGRIILFYPDDL
jgi:hypothetical protein